MKKLICYIFLSMLFVSTIAFAKRAYVEYHDNIIVDGIEYRAIYEDGYFFHTAFIKATNVKTKVMLWKKKVYSTLMNPVMEHDVQWVMIEGIEFKSNFLLIVDEKRNHYTIDLNTVRIKK